MYIPRPFPYNTQIPVHTVCGALISHGVCRRPLLEAGMVQAWMLTVVLCFLQKVCKELEEEKAFNFVLLIFFSSYRNLCLCIPPAVEYHASGSGAACSGWPKISLTYSTCRWGLWYIKHVTAILFSFPFFPFSSLFSYFLFPLSSLRPMAVAVLCTPGLCGDADEGCGAEHVDVHVCEKLVPTPQPPSHLTDPEASLPPLGRLETWYELLIHLEKCHIYHCWGFFCRMWPVVVSFYSLNRFWVKKFSLN